MSSPILIPLKRRHTVSHKDGEEVTVNMARVLYVDPSAKGGSIITMNIPDSTLHVQEDPDTIRQLTREAQKGL